MQVRGRRVIYARQSCNNVPYIKHKFILTSYIIINSITHKIKVMRGQWVLNLATILLGKGQHANFYKKQKCKQYKN